MICAFLFLFLAASARGLTVALDEECLNFTVYPVQYELTIKPQIYTSEYFFYDCELVITAIANAPHISVIELDARDMEIKSVMVFRDRHNIINRNSPYSFDRSKLYIYLSEPLLLYKEHGVQYQIRIVFKKVVGYGSTGVTAVKYNDDIEGNKYMIFTRLSRNHAQYFFPCFGNNRFDSVFKFIVHTVPGGSGLQFTNSSLVIAGEQRQERKNNYVIIEYLPSPQVSLNEVGFVISQFGKASIRARDTNDTIVIWAPTPTLLHYRFILQFGRNIMNLIYEYTKVDRRITSGPINVVSVPSGDLDGYEISSWNLLTNGDIRLAYVPELTSIRQLEKMMFELTQQLCRIWLGNPGEQAKTIWKEEWFKEGMATYLAYYFLGRYHHNGESLKSGWPYQYYGMEMRHKAMLVDWHHITPALVSFNRTLAVEIPERYNELVTMKTASLLWMVENWIGTEKFHAALLKYIKQRRGSYISLEDFLMNLDKETVECFDQFFNGSTSSRVLNSWIHDPGYPVITVQVFRDTTPNKILLKQRKFSYAMNFRRYTTYLIPISYKVQHYQNCFNCHQPRFTISTPSYAFMESLNGGWIILNRQGSGYYRVNYDVHTWKLIAKTLFEDHQSITDINRAQIVNDVFALYVAGDLSYELAIMILNYLEHEESHVVWESAIAGFEMLKIEDATCNFTRALYEEWREFMRKNIKSVYETVIDNLKQQHQTRLFRSNIITFACGVQHEPCLERAQRVYEQALKSGGGLDPDSRQACYYTALETNGNLNHNMTRFEGEDKKIAQYRMGEEGRLIYRLPPGSKQTENYVNINNTVFPPSASPVNKPEPDSCAALKTSITCLLLACIHTLL